MRRGAVFFIGGLLMAGLLVAGIALAQQGTGNPLTDIKGHWAESYINEVVSRGFMQGRPGGRFAPEDPIKRGEIAKLVTNLATINDGQLRGLVEQISNLEAQVTTLQQQVTAFTSSNSKGTFTFTNNESQAVNDLHIEFNTPVDLKKYSPFRKVKNNNTSSVDLYDGDVAAGASVEIYVEGQGNEVYVKQWWWTKGSYGKDGRWQSQRVGDVHQGEPQ